MPEHSPQEVSNTETCATGSAPGPHRIHPLAVRRTLAYATDAVSYLGVAAATVPLGLLVRRTVGEPSRGLVLALSALPPAIATAWAAHRESSTHGATWGKNRFELRVVSEEGTHRLSPGRAIVRNVVKIGGPWQLGHVVAVSAAFGGFDQRDPLTIGSTIICYPLLGLMSSLVICGSGRGLHDRLARSCVTDVSITADHRR